MKVAFAVVMFLKLLLVLAGVFILGWIVTSVHAKPLAVNTTQAGASIVLTDEPCTLKVVSNLPYHVIWTEKGVTYSGCWGGMGDVVLAYFDDGSVVAMPVRHFKAAVEV